MTESKKSLLSNKYRQNSRNDMVFLSLPTNEIDFEEDSLSPQDDDRDGSYYFTSKTCFAPKKKEKDFFKVHV